MPHEEARETTFVPIFEKDGNKLFLLYESFTANDEDHAFNIGFGAFVEAFTYDMTFTERVLEVNIKNIPHIKAEIGNMSVAVISGPMFDEAKSD